MAQCMNALADKVHNKKCHAHRGMHSIPWPHYSTTIPTLVTINLVPTRHCHLWVYVGMVVELWPYYGVHTTMCMALLVRVLCQPVHSCIEPHIPTLPRFLFRNLFMETCFCFFFFWQEVFTVPPMHSRLHACVIHAHAPTNCIQQLVVHSAPSVFPAEKRRQLHSKQSTKAPPKRILWLLAAVSKGTLISLRC